MKKKTVRWATAIGALACAGSVWAHHSISMFDLSQSVWVKGTVVRYEPISPHARFELEERKPDGQVQRWTIEGPIPRRLQRVLSFNGMPADEDFLRAGDVIEVCGFRPKRSGSTGSASAEVDVSRPYIHGQLLVMPNGRMQSWGGYGKLDNCIRPNDQPQTWLDFLEAEPAAHQLWCNRFVEIASTAPAAFVDEIDSRLTQPCN